MRSNRRSKARTFAATLCLTLLLTLLSANFAFAAGLELVESFPEDGNTSLEKMNLMVKLSFNQDMSAESARAANADKFLIKSADGKVKPAFKIMYDPQDPNKVALMMTEDLSTNTDYIAVVSPEVQSSTGEVLGKEIKINFGTRDEARDNTVYMVLMVVLVIGMVFFTQHEQKKKAEKEEMEKLAKGDKNAKVNPYKVAKEKGISVEKAIEETERQKQKASKKMGGSAKAVKTGASGATDGSKAASQSLAVDATVEEADSKVVYRVHTKRVAKKTFQQKKQQQEQEKKRQQKQKQAQKNKKKK